jgi:two-component sensor histidine kinase
VATSITERAWCVVIPHHPQGAGLARHRIQAELVPLVPPEMLADVITVVAELVGNSIRHARPLPGDVVRVAWTSRYAGGDQIVEVRVTDGGAESVPHRRLLEVDSPDGRGIAIVEALAARWGVDRDGLGQSVWAEIVGSVHPGAGR